MPSRSDGIESASKYVRIQYWIVDLFQNIIFDRFMRYTMFVGRLVPKSVYAIYCVRRYMIFPFLLLSLDHHHETRKGPNLGEKIRRAVRNPK